MNADNWAREENRRYREESNRTIEAGSTVVRHYCGGSAKGTVLKVNRLSYRIHFPSQPGSCEEKTLTLPKNKVDILSNKGKVTT